MKGIIVISKKYAKEHTKDVRVFGIPESEVQVHTKVDTIKPEDLPKKSKDFEVKDGKVVKKLKTLK
jgi:hypothetical protein